MCSNTSRSEDNERHHQRRNTFLLFFLLFYCYGGGTQSAVAPWRSRTTTSAATRFFFFFFLFFLVAAFAKHVVSSHERPISAANIAYQPMVEGIRCPRCSTYVIINNIAAQHVSPLLEWHSPFTAARIAHEQHISGNIVLLFARRIQRRYYDVTNVHHNASSS